MSVRFDGTANTPYTATTGLPSTSVVTVTFWARIVVDRNAFSGLCAVAASVGGASVFMTQTDSDGTTLRMWDTAASLGSQAMTVGTWYQLAYVVSGANASFYSGPASTLNVSSTASFAPTGSTPGYLSIGRDQFSGDYLNGGIAAFKMWNAGLNATEVAAELAQFAPVRSANLLRYHPFHVAETTDYSGNSNTLTAGTTAATTESDPPIPEVAGVTPRLVVRSQAVMRSSSF
jgi:hypothetical protein